MVQAKPDCTGQRFGVLTVLDMGEIIKDKKGKSRRFLNLICDCGRSVKTTRENLEKVHGTRSCGCLRWQNSGRKPKDIAGQRFGSLVALHLTGRKRDNKPTWLLQCDCGGFAEMSLTRLGQGHRLNCGNRSVHHLWLHYPPAPTPYPPEASKIVVKYLRFTKYENYGDSALEDMKVDRLIRAAWIISYRRSEGEKISELHEKRIINKYLRYSGITLFWQRELEKSGGLLYTAHGVKKEIGTVMTDLTSSNEAVSTEGKTQPEKRMSTVRKSRRFKFQRR